MTRSRRHRGYWLIAIIGLASLAVACGRATEDEINAALGITPTATMSANDVTTATAESAANSTRIAEGGDEGDSAAGDTTDLAGLGNPLIGRTAFLSNCTGCHAANNSGVAPALPGSTGLAAPLTDMQVYNVIREGINHSVEMGGPGPRANLTDKQIYDMIAFIRSQP